MSDVREAAEELLAISQGDLSRIGLIYERLPAIQAVARAYLDLLSRRPAPAGEVAEERFAELKRAQSIIIDEPQRVLTDGSPVPADDSHTRLRPDGQQEGYVVLSEAERAKGFVRPVRRTYMHLKCGTTTKMALSIAETLARDPKFYSGGFCYGCKAHFPNDELVWEGTDVKVGT